MRLTTSFLIGVIATTSLPVTVMANGLSSAIKNGSVNGNIRSYYFTRDFETKTNEKAYSLGGALRAETGLWGAFQMGVGFYTAQDLGTNNSNPDKVNKRLGSDLEVLGEAYLKATLYDTALTIGRQKVNTPFANPGDAFMIPFTFEGASVINNSIENLTLEADLLNTIKNRNSDEFVDVGKFSTSRYGVPQENTSGTLILGAKYKIENSKLQAWYYDFDDLFTTAFLQANHSFSEIANLKPFVAAQFGSQTDSGKELLGKVDTKLYGVQGGAGLGKAKLTLAYNSVSEKNSAFKNGAFLAPYNFSTSPLFTNNQLTTLENLDSGDAAKITFNYNFGKAKLKLSYADFNLDNVADREAADFDFIYDLDNLTDGLTARFRFEQVFSDLDSVEQANYRFQLQLVY